METVENTFTEKYVRKPLIVDAVRITEENFKDIVRFCAGTVYNNDETIVPQGAPIDPNNQYIYVRVHKPKNTWQTQARVGDWILYAPRSGFKVYNDKAFKASFDKYEDVSEEFQDVGDNDSEEDSPTTVPDLTTSSD